MTRTNLYFTFRISQNLCKGGWIVIYLRAAFFWQTMRVQMNMPRELHHAGSK